MEWLALARDEEIEAATSESPQTLTVLSGSVMAGSTAGDVGLGCGATAMVAAAQGRVRLSATTPAVVVRTWVPDLAAEVVALALATGQDPRELAARTRSFSVGLMPS
jgi:hypothetical protein